MRRGRRECCVTLIASVDSFVEGPRSGADARGSARCADRIGRGGNPTRSVSLGHPTNRIGAPLRTTADPRKQDPVITLALIGLLGGLITGISPCILPVLPVIFLTGGAQWARFDGDPIPASRWRPYLVIAGLVTSFTLVTLVGSLLLGALRLPPDIIRWVGIAVLVLIGVGLLVPRVEQLLERPFQKLARRSEVTNKGSGYGVGLALGAVFVPCA